MNGAFGWANGQPARRGKSGEGSAVRSTGGWVATTTSAVLLMVACTLMPRTLGALGPFIVSDLDLSPSRFGALVSMVFGISALTAIGCARFVDRFPTPWLMRALLLVVVVDVVMVSRTSTYLWLILAVGLAGLSQGLANPVANRVVRTGVPVAHRALAIGLKQSAVQFGTAFAAFVLPTIALALGWHRSVLAILLLPLLALAVSFAASPGSQKSERPPPRVAVPARGRLPRRDDDGAWRLAAYSFFIAAGVSGVATYVTLYVHDVLGFSEATAGLVLGFVGLAAVAARIGWAQVAGARPESGRVAAFVAGAGAAAATLLALSPVAAGWLAWLGAVGVGATAMGANAVSNLSVVRRSTSASTGHSSAVVAFGFFCGFIPGPVLFGLVVESRLGWSGAWGLVVLELALASWIVADRGRVAPWQGREGGREAGTDESTMPGLLDTDG
jgi:predicted MFS family arabinose efflux permease